MRAVTTTGIVGPDHTLTVQMPADIPLGTHQVVVVIQGAPRPPPQLDLANWPVYDVGPTDPTMTYRREDLYGDDGR